ncbi:uncharacterized protein LOC107641493 [Arachis ipaensis]|uniref:uncharacterized protein LOC107641493 n=1 Tax=Arachis ipaensis TaxID=130454 RepID=UPI0007AFC393|nr:uncharacterized protein LOC107641493 [Arachis ipaensis]
MELGNGRTIRFWEDSWLPNGALKDKFPRLFSVSTLTGAVIGDCGFWDGLDWIWSFQWRRELFQWELDLVRQLHETLQSAKPTNEREDTVTWKFDNTGVYSTSSFTQMIQAKALPAEITSYSFTRAIWKGFVPPRIELLSWFVLVGRMNTKDRLCRLRVLDQNDNQCVVCLAACIWKELVPPGNLKDHFESWISMAIWKIERNRWFIGFFAVVWTIWLERNSRLFQNHVSSLRDIINKSFAFAEEWIGGEPFGC